MTPVPYSLVKPPNYPHSIGYSPTVLDLSVLGCAGLLGCRGSVGLQMGPNNNGPGYTTVF